MLRKAIHIIFSTLLLIATTGLFVSKHYCGGNLVSTSLFVEAEFCCDSQDCCKNETSFFQLDEDLFSVTIIDIPVTVSTDLLATIIFFIFDNYESFIEGDDFIVSNLPPPPKLQTALSHRQSYLL